MGDLSRHNGKEGSWHVAGDQRAVPISYFQWRLDADVTVSLALVAATQRLISAKVDSPRLDSEVLLAHVLGWSRSRLYTAPEQRLKDVERQRFEELIERRFHHEPVAYLVGRKAFFGLDLVVDRRVLIPRPETEQLVEMVLDLVNQADHLHRSSGGSNGHGPVSTNGARPVTVADVGTGSGAIALAVAANTSHTSIYALDISQHALQLASKNARLHHLAHRITFMQGDLLAPLPGPVDLIVANLPYVALNDWPQLAPDIADFEPSLALAGGADGLDVIRRLLQQAPTYLLPQGALLLEIGSGQGHEAARLAAQTFPEASIEVLSDYGSHDRIVWVKT